MKVEIDKDKLIHLKGCLDHVANEFWIDIESPVDAVGLIDTINIMKEWLQKEESSD